jgi:hypothetical protein
LGAFFTNLQVHRPGPGGAAGQDAVVRALRQHLGVRYAEAAAGEEPDRVILVGPPGAGGWVPVFDEESEGQDEGVLHGLARPISRETGGAVVTVLVHDSDVAYLRLFERGEQVDSWVSDPGWGGQRLTADQRRAVRGQPGRWAGLLAGGATPQDLQRAWKARPVLAEHSVSAVARLLGMDETLAATGYRYLTQEGVPAGFASLALRLRERPPDESCAIGPPAFRRGAYFPTLELAVGELLALSLGVRNAGGESRGILVAVWGEALARGLVTIEPVRVVGHGEAARAEGPFTPTEAEGQTVWMARFPDFPVPAGTADPEGAARRSRRSRAAAAAAEIHVYLRGRAEAPGEGPLHVGVGPLANPPGQLVQTTELTVRRPAHIPARRGTRPAGEFLLKMEDPRILVGLVTLGAARATAAEAAADAIARWSATLSPDRRGRYQVNVLGRGGEAPRRERLAAGAIGAGKRWDAVRAELSTCLAFSATLERTVFFPDPLAIFGSGFLWGAEPLAGAGSRGAACPHVALWLDLEDLDDGQRAAAAAVLEGLVDDLVTRASGVQAFVARWAWAPIISADATPYELACGIHGQVTTTRRWCSRFLRAVTDRLWLGPALLERIGGPAVLAPVADVRPVGELVALVLRPPATLADLARVLAPLLPGQSDWEEAWKEIREQRSRG